MFSYVDPAIRQKLEHDDRLIDLDRQGLKVNGVANSEPFIALLGPIPMPRVVAGRKVD
jgi:hypothetical protein